MCKRSFTRAVWAGTFGHAGDEDEGRLLQQSLTLVSGWPL